MCQWNYVINYTVCTKVNLLYKDWANLRTKKSLQYILTNPNIMIYKDFFAEENQIFDQ